MIVIDGSMGEGGGQILRTALALSCVTGKPLSLHNIRKNRKKPGLQPQHLAAVRAAAQVSGAKVGGDRQNSLELLFEPGPVKAGEYGFDIGTAGSTTLLFQTVLPPLCLAEGRSVVTIKGGTHNPLAPPFDFIKEVFLPTLNRFGINAEASIERYGFYPKGGGEVRYCINGAKQIKGGGFSRRGNLLSLTGVSAVANLPLSIAERQKEAIIKRLEKFSPEIAAKSVPSPGTGTYVFLLARYEHALAGFSSLGERGKRAELVGEEAAMDFLVHDATGAALDPYMADQLALYLALSRSKSSFTTSEITGHLLTNLGIAQMFVPFEYEVKGEKGAPGTVEIGNIKG